MCSAICKNGMPCPKGAEKGSDPPLCWLHGLPPEGRALHMRAMAHAPRRARVLALPDLRCASDAIEASRRIARAYASGDITEGQARRLEAQVGLYLKARECKEIDFEAAWARREAELKRRLGR